MLFANQDLVNEVTVGGTTSVFPDSPAAVIIPPLGSIAVLGRDLWYAVAPAGTTALLVIPGGTQWSPSPAQVALQIAALGLARDTTVQGVNSSVQSQTSGVTIAQDILQTGAPPFVPSLQAATVVRQAVAVTKFFTFPSAGRIWSVALSYFTTTNASYSISTSQTYAAVETTPPASDNLSIALTLGIVELGAADPNQGFSGQSNLSFNGLPVPAGTGLMLDVNAGSLIANLNQRASAVVLYSIP